MYSSTWKRRRIIRITYLESTPYPHRTKESSVAQISHRNSCHPESKTHGSVHSQRETFREVGTSRDQGNLLFFSFQQSVVVSQSQSVRQSQSLVSLSKSLPVAMLVLIDYSNVSTVSQ